MKEWNEPQLLSIGVENTFEDAEAFAKPGHTDATYHYCHNLNVNLPTCQYNPQNHSGSGNKGHKFTGKDCKQHGYLGGNSACCCMS